MCKVDQDKEASTNEEEGAAVDNDDDDNEAHSSPEPVIVPKDDDEESENVNVDTEPATTKKTTKQEEYYRTNVAEYNGILERYAVRIANRPCLHFWVALAVSLGIGMVGLVVGDFSVAVDNDGWYSRGTLIADRAQQYWLVDSRRQDLFDDKSGGVWDTLVNNRQTLRYDDDDDDATSDRRLVVEDTASSFSFVSDWGSLGSSLQSGMQFLKGKRKIESDGDSSDARNSPSAAAQEWLVRRLQTAQEQSSLGPLEGCDVNWYNSSSMFTENRLWPVYKNTRPDTTSLWDGPALQEMCETEDITQRYLEENKLCLECDSQGDHGNKRCLQPYSPVLFARLTVDNGLTMSCQELAETWAASYQTDIELTMRTCVEVVLSDYNPFEDGAILPENACPVYFFPHMLDDKYPAVRDYISHASAIYATPYQAVDALYDGIDKLGYSSQYMETFYDTQYEDLGTIETDNQVLIDRPLAVGSARYYLRGNGGAYALPILGLGWFVADCALLSLGLFLLSLCGKASLLSVLNFIGIFVLFALGADDVFVAVDKWKNARLARPNAPAQEIAAKAFPDAAGAMLLTTLTTAVAFFGTAVCPVAPILCFAVFVGLLVVGDYILCCLLVFPALVVYDNRMQAEKRTGCCCHCGLHSCCCCFVKARDPEEHANEEEELDEDNKTPSLIHRILDHYYKFLHRFRWLLLVVCAGALVISAIKAAQIELPVSADVRLFDESDNQFEANYVHRQNLLFEVVKNKAGSTTDVIWGVIPADTGNHNNPESWTKLKLDPTFEPSREDVQVYLLDFCDSFFANEFATRVRSDYKCAMEQLNEWLAEQAAAEAPEDIYTENCAGATGLPIPQANFDACTYAWSQGYGVDDVLAREGKITILSFEFSSRVRYDSPQNELENEWDMTDNWIEGNRGPEGAGNPYFTSEDFWWFDTNAVMLETAYTSAGIAMGAAAAVILFSSRSFMLTLFATVTVGYVLTSVTAMLVALGWTLGFLESILFAILIGISCDFVIHFSHAYASLEGQAPRHERTRFALISMGPSILAAAFTTFAAALVMLFCIVSFFEKFAIILFLTIAQSTVGSFVVFLVLVDCIGPSDPTHLVDHLLSRCYAKCGKEYHVQADESTQHFNTKEFNAIDRADE